MLYRQMPRSQDKLSTLGFGCMRFQETNGKIDESKASEQLTRAIEKGVNYLDTAMPYHMGQSEPFLGRYLAKGLRQKIYIATKLPSWQVRQTQDMERLFQTQLQSLQTDYIDYYLIHNLDDVKWKAMEQFGVQKFLDKQIKAGKIRHAGFSFHGDKDTFKTIVDNYDWTFAQIQYNFLDIENQAGKEGLDYAEQKKMGVIIMEPLRGGVLAGRVPNQVRALWDQADIKRTPADWSLRWIWNHKAVTTVLSGMNTNEQIDENCQIASEAGPDILKQKELELVASVRETYRKLMRAGCTGCRYCMPCPTYVNIPQCLDLLNNWHMYGKNPQSKMMYPLLLGGVLGGNQGFASQCKECGKCEKACPQNLPIQELLKETKNIYEGVFLKPFVWMGKMMMSMQRSKALKATKKK